MFSRHTPKAIEACQKQNYLAAFILLFMTESCLSILSSSWARVESRDVLRVWRVIFIISSVSSILPFFRRAFIMGIVMPVADIAASLLKTLSRRL